MSNTKKFRASRNKKDGRPPVKSKLSFDAKPVFNNRPPLQKHVHAMHLATVNRS